MVVTRKVAPRAKIGMWTSPENKEKFAALAVARGMSESALLALLVDHVLETNPALKAPPPPRDEGASSERITLRLRPGDRALVDTRANARGMKVSSYLVALVRAHVRSTAPLPTDELNTLKVALGELSAVGRNLNQIARALNAGAGAGATRGLLKHLESVGSHVDQVRRDVSGLVRVNLMSWEAGDG